MSRSLRGVTRGFMDRRQDPLRVKSRQLGIEVVQYARSVLNNRGVPSIVGQLIRSGTASGAILSEALEAESKKDLIHKLRLALKEALETDYWLDLIETTGIDESAALKNMRSLNGEVVAMLKASLNTLVNG